MYSDVEVSTAAELLNELLRNELFRPKGYFDSTAPGASGYVFRGQANRDWPLTPSVHRSPTSLSRFVDQPPPERELAEGKLRPYLGFHMKAELRAVHLFLKQADALGITTPLDYALTGVHSDLIQAAWDERDSDYSTPFPHVSVRAGLALAQHHGVPTRLLDWTESPLIAAYFAAAPIHELQDFGQATHFAVLCLDTKWLQFSDGNLVEVPALRHANGFLQAQKGVFTLMPKANQFFLEHHRWSSIEDIVQADRDSHPNRHMVRPTFVRFSAPISEATPLLRLLYQYDITRHHLMPTLANAADAFAYRTSLWPTPFGLP